MRKLIYSAICMILGHNCAFAMHERDVIGTDMVHDAKCGHFFASDSVLRLIEEAKAGQVISEFSAERPLTSEDERELREDALLYIIPDSQKRESFLRELDNSGLDHLSIEAVLVMLPEYDI
jgi:patatin-like phospholipase/acyl hydrolase